MVAQERKKMFIVILMIFRVKTGIDRFWFEALYACGKI